MTDPKKQAKLWKRGWRWKAERKRYELPYGDGCWLAAVVIEPKDYGTWKGVWLDWKARWTRFWLTH